MALLLLAGLALVPDELHEAAKVDGATAWQRFWRITIPLMKPAILVALLFRTLDAFRIFDSVYHPDQRGAEPDTETVSILGYNQLLNRLNLGLGSAISVLIFICVVDHRLPLRQGLRHVAPRSSGGEVMLTRTARTAALGDRRSSSSLVYALIPVAVDHLAVAQDAGDGRPTASFFPQECVVRQLQRASSTQRRLHRRAAQLDRHRADRHGDRGRRSPRWPPTRSRGWTSRARALILAGRAGDRHVPADLDRRPAVQHVARASASTTRGPA